MFYSYIRKKNEIKNAEKSLIPNVFAFFASERSFSTTKHLKTWLRSTMTNRCFNSQGLLNVHKDLTEKLDFAEVGNEFTSLNED